MSEAFRYYVAGFLLKGDHVLLVRKNRPKWQDGFLNGIGGEVEGSETPEQAMEREFHEEAGAVFCGWDLFANEVGPGYAVSFFRLRIASDYVWTAPKWNDVGEELRWIPLQTKEPVIGNLNWLLPLALDPRKFVANLVTLSSIKEIVTW